MRVHFISKRPLGTHILAFPQLPGVGAAVLGSMAGFVGAAVMLFLVGRPLGIEVPFSRFSVSFPWRLLEVGKVSSEEWGWLEVLLDDLAFSESPMAVKPCTTGPGIVATGEGSAVEVPAGA